MFTNPYTQEDAPMLYTPMGEILMKRIQALNNPAYQLWAVRMIREWSRNEETSLQIVTLAELYTAINELTFETGTKEFVIETGNGSLKANPIHGVLTKLRTQAAALSKRLNITADITFEGEHYD